jgi:hypothetical protein
MKKALKITGIVILSLIVILLLAPFLFAGTIEDAVKKSINKEINAEVAWEDLSLSLFSSFPDAQLTLKNLSIVNKAPFEGDTLAKSGELSLDLGVMQLFNMGEEPLAINELKIDNALINIKVDSLDRANYDIAKKTTPTETVADTTATGLTFDIQHYEIKSTDINYLDQKSKTFLRVKNLDHEGTGDFSAKQSRLETTSKALVSFQIDSTEYLNEVPLELVADINMDLENQKYTFLENEALVNQLPLRFDGYVKVNENNNEVNLTFKTPSSDFKNFLAVIPKEYSKNIENVKTTGNFIVNGKIQGIVDDKHIPKLGISVRSEDASFKYPDLPKTVEDIAIIANLKNDTGLAEDTYLTLDKLNFRIDQDIFSAKGRIDDLTENMKIDMDVSGTLNLANLEKAYPLDLEQDLNGILKADMSTQFDMESVEKERYQNIKTNGTASLSNFRYVSPEIPNPVNIETMKLDFSTGKISLKQMKASSGQTDANVSGTLQNLMGFLFADSDLKGNFNLNSNTFAVNDFMIAETETPSGEGNTEARSLSSTEEAIKIPSFLDVSLDFTADKVLYDNLVLENMTGKLILKDETATLQNVSSNIFGGKIALDGNVSTKPETPTFQMNLDLSSINIAQSFTSMELIQSLAPIAKALQGTLNTDIQLNGKLNNDLTPILTSLAGGALAEVLQAEVQTSQMPLLSKLDGKLNFLDLNNINLKDLQTQLEFKDGQVHLKPFDFDVKGINITVSGAHGFDNSMDYNLALDIPAKYLGSEIGGKLANLSGTDLENMKVELPIGLTGTFANPQIKMNTEAAVKNLTQQIVEEQKENLRDKATDKIKDILGGGDEEEPANQTTQDSTKTQQPKSKEEQIKDAAKDILGGFLNRGKKDTTSTNQP